MWLMIERSISGSGKMPMAAMAIGANVENFLVTFLITRGMLPP
jgi:hypothetical protein